VLCAAPRVIGKDVEAQNGNQNVQMSCIWLIARRDAARVEFEGKKRAIQTRLRAPERPRARGRARMRLRSRA
jgi:hypothetical protein